MASDLDQIVSSIDELASRAAITRSRAFAAWYAINFHDLDEDDALEAASADGGNDQGIDLVFADEAAEEIIVLQAHCPDNFDKSIPKSKWDAAVSSLAFLRNPRALAAVGRPDLSDTILQIVESYPNYKFSIGLISLGRQTLAIDRSVKVHQQQNNDVVYFCQTQESIIENYRALIESAEGVSDDSLTFSGGHIEDSGEYGRAWIGSVSAVELQRLHTAHGNKLYAGNIRLFLGSRKGGINEQIINTARTAPGTFWALNNGITIVADTATPRDGSTADSILDLRRFSIVNGCQTTHSLVRAEASANTKVLARVIAAKANIRNDIVRYNNSQNAIKIWTVRAADNTQQQLQREFKRMGIDYAPRQEGSRKKKGRMTIELDKVAQYIASSENNFLIQAIDNKSELFDEPYQKLFPKDIEAKTIFLAWVVGAAADVERRSLVADLGSDGNSALLSVTSDFWIIYATYKLLRKFSDIDSSHITVEKMKTADFENAIRKYTKEASSIFFDAAVDTYDRSEYGSIKSTLRSQKFLQKVDSKLNNRVARIKAKALPDLVSVCRSAKPSTGANAKS